MRDEHDLRQEMQGVLLEEELDDLQASDNRWEWWDEECDSDLEAGVLLEEELDDLHASDES